jgi:16S rRNA C967 or C1407 C5-methylase (RsmB/RsmF family)
LKLVGTGEGVQYTRQRQPKTRLSAIAGDNLDNQKALNNVLERLVQSRLLVTGEKPQEQQEDLVDLVQETLMVDLAHEALMEGWQRFAQWRKENRPLLRLINRVEDALREWQKSQEDENLMMGGLLAQVRQNWQELEATYHP